MKKPLAYVTDHAVLRYLERVRGVDVEAVRCELGQKVGGALEAGASATIVNGFRYVLVEGALVSCVPVKSTPPHGRANRRRAREEADEE